LWPFVSFVKPGYAQTPRGFMHYVEAGTGEPLLLLHANPRSHRYFRYALPSFAQGARTIAVDIPGFGNSHPVPDPPSVRSLAECFVHFLDALGIERANFFGLHTGNKIVAALAAEWPSRVASAVLAGQTHSLILDKSGRDAAIREIVEHYFPQYPDSADGAHLVRRWAAVHAEVQALWWPQRLRTAAAISPADAENAEAHVLDYLQGWRSIVPVYEAIFAFDMEAALRRMEARTLVLELVTLHEERLGRQAERLCAVMKNAQPAVVHADGEVFETDPDEVVRTVVRFLGAPARR
jgi:pimeloyl-ACP methyl ester carboxylesterase